MFDAAGWHIIDDGTPEGETHDARFARGCTPRDYNVSPPEMFAPPSEIPIIPDSDWEALIKEQQELKSSIYHRILTGNRGKKIPTLNQNPLGYCWAHSSTQGVVARRAVDGLPFIPMSAFSVAATIMKGRDEGGWCGLSAEFIEQRGVMSQDVWPQGDLNYKKYDKPENWTEAAKHKITYEFRDLAAGHYYFQNLNWKQLVSCLLLNIPCPVDFNWWGHSVLAVAVVLVDGEICLLIWNSWGDEWGTGGFGILRGSKKMPNSALAIVSTTLSPAEGGRGIPATAV